MKEFIFHMTVPDSVQIQGRAAEGFVSQVDLSANKQTETSSQPFLS